MLLQAIQSTPLPLSIMNRPCSNTDLLVGAKDDDSNWEATSVDNNQLAFELQVGDNFVVRANLRNEEKTLFWVFKCVKMLVHV